MSSPYRVVHVARALFVLVIFFLSRLRRSFEQCVSFQLNCSSPHICTYVCFAQVRTKHRLNARMYPIYEFDAIFVLQLRLSFCNIFICAGSEGCRLCTCIEYSPPSAALSSSIHLSASLSPSLLFGLVLHFHQGIEIE